MRPADLEADGEHLFILRCPACALEDHAGCSGRPDGVWPAVCRCRQCWRTIALAEWRAARVRNSTQAMRMWGDAIYAAARQAEARQARRAARPLALAPCVGCGRPVSIRRRDRRGPWCGPACKMTHARRRWRAQTAQDAAGATPIGSAGSAVSGQAERQQGDSREAADATPWAPRPAPAAQLSPAELWALIHRG